MPDDMDLCQQISLDLIDDALAERKRNRPTGAGLNNCAVCGDEIPEARRLAIPGCCKCIACQMEWEMMHGR